MKKQRKAGSLNVLVRRRRMRRRVVPRVATVKPLRDLAADPKWKNPTPWDEHTFRVGVLTELRHVRSPNATGSATEGRP